MRGTFSSNIFNFLIFFKDVDDVESAPTVFDVKAKEKMEKEVGGNCCGGVEIPPFLGTVAKLSLIYPNVRLKITSSRRVKSNMHIC